VLNKRQRSQSFEITDLNGRSPPGICLRKLCATNSACLRNFFATTQLFNQEDEKKRRDDDDEPFLFNFIDPSCPPLTR